MKMKKKWVDAYMDTAERFAKLSSATRLHVGSIIVKENRIISIGYNGMPSGWTNVCEDPDGITKPEVIHAEANAIIKLAREGESGRGATLFVTHAPCVHCAKMIYGAGIEQVCYREKYRDDMGLVFLAQAGVNVEIV